MVTLGVAAFFVGLALIALGAYLLGATADAVYDKIKDGRNE